MSFSPTEPRLLPCWEAHVDIAPTQDHGPGPDGHRFVVPILGGRFAGRLAPETDAPRPFEAADRIEVHDDGTFAHLGRADGVIKIGGVRVSLAEIERRVLAIDGVRDAGVIARDVGGARGHEICLAVVAPELDAKTIRAGLRSWLAPVAMPRRIKLLDALPRTQTGKLPRAALETLFTRSTR